MHSFDRPNQHFFDVSDSCSKLCVLVPDALALYQGKVRVDCRESLAKFVMEFTADALPLFLLHVKNLKGLLLPANHALALLDETHRNGVGNAIGRGLISIEDAPEQFKVSMILAEKRASQNVSQEEDDAEHFTRLDAAVNDAPGQVPGVRLQILYASRFQNLYVVVVDCCGFHENLFAAHGGKQLSFVNAACPFLAQGRAVEPQMRH